MATPRVEIRTSSSMDQEDLSGAPTFKGMRKNLRDRLPRQIWTDKAMHGYRVNRPNELMQPDTGEEAPLYPLCAGLESFGLGISLYFRQLVFFMVSFVCAGIILSAALAHNAKDCKHSGTGKNEKNRGLVVGSAAGCAPQDLKISENIVPDMLVCFGILGLTFWANHLEEFVETRIDLSQQTPSDYSIQVSNPPDYEDDLDKYWHFFSDFFNTGKNREDVVAVSMSKDNGRLMQLLTNRRAFLQDLKDLQAKERRLEGATSSLNLNPVQKFLQPYIYSYGFLKTREFAEAEIQRIEHGIQALLAESQATWQRPRRVIVTFGSEEAQHRALDAYEVSGLKRIIANATGLAFDDTPRAFDDGTVLKVEKPVEPSEIFWHNSHVTLFERSLRLALTIAITGGLLAIVCVVAIALKDSWQFTLSVFITLVNAGLPPFIKFISENIERPKDFGDLQDWMFLKLTTARWINTAVAVFISYSTRERLSQEALSQVMLILLADAFLNPVIRLVDPYDCFLRFIVAPRQPTQRAANVFWKGAEWNIAERYTDVSNCAEINILRWTSFSDLVSKTLFVGLFYSAAMPSALFVTAAAMVTTFCADRYCLLRKWRRAPEIDAQLAKRTIGIIAIIIFLHTWVASFFFLNWGTYSSVDDDEDFPEKYTDRAVDCFNSGGLMNCRFKKSELTRPQKFAWRAYRPLGFIAFVLALWKFFGIELKRIAYELCCGGKTKSRPEPNLDPFRTLPDAHVYVPLVAHLSLEDPVIAADISQVPRKFLPVSDPDGSNVATVDEIAPFLGNASDPVTVVKDVFGKVTFYEAPGPDDQVPVHHQPNLPKQQQPPPSDDHRGDEDDTQEVQQHKLPPGWEEKIDDFGRHYFVDNINKKTHWHPPTY